VLTQSPSVDVVVKGMRLMLPCAADGNPPVTYTWIKVLMLVLTMMAMMMGGSVVQWLGRRTCDREIASSTPGRSFAG